MVCLGLLQRQRGNIMPTEHCQCLSFFFISNVKCTTSKLCDSEMTKYLKEEKAQNSL